RLLAHILVPKQFWQSGRGHCGRTGGIATPRAGGVGDAAARVLPRRRRQPALDAAIVLSDAATPERFRVGWASRPSLGAAAEPRGCALSAGLPFYRRVRHGVNETGGAVTRPIASQFEGRRSRFKLDRESSRRQPTEQAALSVAFP